MTIRRALAATAAATVLLLPACSSDDDGDGGDGAASTTAGEAPGTTGGTTDTTTAPTDTIAGGSGLAALAEELEGDWAGSWTNTTFDSTGDATGSMTVDADAGVVDVTFDLGGNVFGAPDPDAETFSLPLEAGTHTGTSAVFGDYEVTVDEDGAFEVTATGFEAIPGGTFTASGTVSPDGFSGSYEVDFGDGSPPAEGTFELTKS